MMRFLILQDAEWFEVGKGANISVMDEAYEQAEAAGELEDFKRQQDETYHTYLNRQILLLELELVDRDVEQALRIAEPALNELAGVNAGAAEVAWNAVINNAIDKAIAPLRYSSRSGYTVCRDERHIKGTDSIALADIDYHPPARKP